MTKKALFILTSTDHFLKDGEKQATGFYWEEMTEPYWALRDEGFQVTLASIEGGRPPADPSSAKGEAKTESVGRFMDDNTAMQALANTKKAADCDARDFDVVYLPGGHGTMWDLAQTEAVGRIVSDAYANGAVVGAVCHGPAGLLKAVDTDGQPLLAGKRVNGFTNAAEDAAGLSETVPFLLETEMRALGGKFVSNDEPFGPYAVRDGRLVTGQNPASSGEVAKLLLEAAADKQDAAA